MHLFWRACLILSSLQVQRKLPTTDQLRWNLQFQNWLLTCSELEKKGKKCCEMQNSEGTHLFLKRKNKRELKHKNAII